MRTCSPVGIHYAGWGLPVVLRLTVQNAALPGQEGEPGGGKVEECVPHALEEDGAAGFRVTCPQCLGQWRGFFPLPGSLPSRTNEVAPLVLDASQVVYEDLALRDHFRCDFGHVWPECTYRTNHLSFTQGLGYQRLGAR